VDFYYKRNIPLEKKVEMNRGR